MSSTTAQMLRKHKKTEESLGFNKLTFAQAERLAWLLEELGEAQQAIGKILRHGYDSYDPTNPNHKGNKNDLVRELMEVYRAAKYMANKGDLTFPPVFNITMKYSHHQNDD